MKRHSTSSYENPPAATDPLEPDVIVAARQGPYLTYFPDVAPLADGRLAVVYYSSRQHMHTPDSRILLTFGSPDGRTWDSSRAIVNMDGMDDRDPSIVQLRSGRLLINWFRRDPEDLTSPDFGCLAATSDDGGATWSDPIPVGTTLNQSAVTAPPLELADGRLLMPLYGFPDPDTPTHVIKLAVSHDQGTTWDVTDEVHVPPHPDPSVGLVEPTLADLGDGRLLMVTRSQKDPRNSAYAFWSDDSGATWTAPARLDFAGHAPHLLRLPRSAAETMILMTWGESSVDDPTTRPVLGRFVDGLDRSLTGRTIELYRNPATKDMSYPSSVQVEDGSCLVIYYDADRGHIGGTFTNAP